MQSPVAVSRNVNSMLQGDGCSLRRRKRSLKISDSDPICDSNEHAIASQRVHESPATTPTGCLQLPNYFNFADNTEAQNSEKLPLKCHTPRKLSRTSRTSRKKHFSSEDESGASIDLSISDTTSTATQHGSDKVVEQPQLSKQAKPLTPFRAHYSNGSDADSEDSTEVSLNSLIPAVSSLMTTCAKPTPTVVAMSPIVVDRRTNLQVAQREKKSPARSPIAAGLTAASTASSMPSNLCSPKSSHTPPPVCNTVTNSESPVSVICQSVPSLALETQETKVLPAMQECLNDQSPQTEQLPVGLAMAPCKLTPQTVWLMNSLPKRETAESCHLLPKESYLLPPKNSDKKFTLVLDLDETLVHCSFESIPDADMEVDINYRGRTFTVFGRRRPHVRAFLKEASQHFELVCFTASQRLYAERIINLIDPDNYISHSLFRDACVNMKGNYVKDLSYLGRDLRHTILLDNSPHAFGLQIDNGVPITSWFSNSADTELAATMEWLKILIHGPEGTGIEDVRPFIRDRFRLRELLKRSLLSPRVQFAHLERLRKSVYYH